MKYANNKKLEVVRSVSGVNITCFTYTEDNLDKQSKPWRPQRKIIKVY